MIGPNHYPCLLSFSIILFCQGDICPPTASRKRRSVTNSTEHKELELSYNLKVYDGIPQIDSYEEEPPTSQPQDDIIDYVRIKKAAFYGILAVFVIVLTAAVVSSCFLFKKARMAGKNAGFKGTGGRSNPSFRAWVALIFPSKP